MNNTGSIFILITALWFAPAGLSLAENTWQTVMDFPCPAPATVEALGKDPAGNLYAAVSTSDAEGRTHAQIRKSSDRGITWTVVEDFVSAIGGATKFLSLGAAANGQLYAAGYTKDEGGQTRWIVKKSGPGGSAWSTVDDYALPGSQTAMAQALTLDPRDGLYVAGFGDGSHGDKAVIGQMRWLVRQSLDGGRTWSTIDDFAADTRSKAFAILSTPAGLLVAGSGWNGKAESGERWIVRKGTPNGTGGFRWQTVDELPGEKAGQWSESRANALGEDAQGNLYAVGRQYAPATTTHGSMHWIVRRASSTGTDWDTVDSFQFEPGEFAAAHGVAGSDRGGVYVVGRAADGQLASRWIVRQSATGEVGSWLVSDDFRMSAPPPSGSKAPGFSTGADDGTVVANSPMENARGVSVLSSAGALFAGGSVHAGSTHAVVRKLEGGRSSELVAKQQR